MNKVLLHPLLLGGGYHKWFINSITCYLVLLLQVRSKEFYRKKGKKTWPMPEGFEDYDSGDPEWHARLTAWWEVS